MLQRKLIKVYNDEEIEKLKKTEYIVYAEVKILDIVGILAPNSLISISRKSEDAPIFNS